MGNFMVQIITIYAKNKGSEPSLQKVTMYRLVIVTICGESLHIFDAHVAYI